MVMNLIDSVNILNGNAYIVKSQEHLSQKDNDFDKIYNKQCHEAGLDEIFAEASEKYGVNLSVLKAVAFIESNFRTNAVSKSGAMGVMQLMPYTAEAYGVADPFDAKQNIEGGAKLLAELLDKYDGNVTLSAAAYNAGSGAVSKYGGVPPYDQTVRYVQKLNDALGGLLTEDSWTVDGAKPTKLEASGGSAQLARNIYVQNQSSSGFLAYSSGIMIKEKTVQEESAREILPAAADGRETVLQDKVADEMPKVADKALKKEAQDAYADEKSVQAPEYTQERMAAMASGVLAAENILRSSPSSLYEAQATVISPLIAQIREL